MGQPESKGLLARLALHRPETRAWAMYDWANSAFMTTVMTAVFPVYFAEVVAKGMDAETIGWRYSMATALALAVIAVMAPVLGAIADLRARKKRLLTVFALIGIAATAGMFFIEAGDWKLALGLFMAANIGAAGSIIFYDSLLPHVAPEGRMDRLSTSSYALGYVGGGVLLALNILWITNPGLIGLPTGEDLSSFEKTLPVRLAFVSVAVWWFLFTIPLWRRIKEPPTVAAPVAAAGSSTLRQAVQRNLATWRELRRYKNAVWMLFAFLLFNDGIVTVMRMATVYATGLGFKPETLITTILLVQFIGIPFAFLFGHLAPRFGAKRLVVAGLGMYCLITTLAFFMSIEWHFIALGVLVATVQGGTQALSRSLFASLIPKHKSGEFFAFFAIGEKFAGIFGPLTFGLVIYLSGSQRNAILSVLPFFVLGALLLSKVNVGEGRRIARAAEAEAEAA